MRRCRAYSMSELLIGLAIAGLLAGTVSFSFSRNSLSAREDQLRRDLHVVRTAVNLFREDTGLWPQNLAALSATSAPAQGVNDLGTNQALDSRNWRGPYLRIVPNDPISRSAFTYVSAPNGYVTSSATGNDSRGVPYANY